MGRILNSFRGLPIPDSIEALEERSQTVTSAFTHRCNFDSSADHANHRLDRNNSGYHRLLSADPSSMGRKMRLGHKRVDMDHMAYRQCAAADLLHRSRGDLVERCAGDKYGIDCYDDRSCSTK